MPRTILEATGATNSGCSFGCGRNPELIIDNESGFLVLEGRQDALFHRLVQIGKQSELRESFANNGFIRYRDNFSRNHQLERLGTHIT